MAIDPISAAVESAFGVFGKWIELKKIDKWFRLIFIIHFSFLLGFSGGMGSALLKTHDWTYGFAMGLLTGGGSAYLAWRNSELSKGTTIAAPSEIINNNTPIDVVNK